MDLRTNELSGTIPSSIKKWTQLQKLYLSDNYLSGVIPSAIGNLGQLQNLYMDNNILTGQMPDEIGNLKRLGKKHTVIVTTTSVIRIIISFECSHFWNSIMTLC